MGCGVAALLGLCAAAVLWTVPDWLVDRLAKTYPGCLYRVPTRNRLIAITIDDGPDPRSSRSILEALRQHEARATFFLIGERVAGQEALVRDLIAQGHEIGNHGTSDRPAIMLDAAAFEADLLAAHALLARFGPLSWARPGSGWYTGEMVETMRRHGYRCALGSVYPYDPAIPSATFARAFILRNVAPGSIVVLHEGGDRGERTAAVLREVLPELRRRGYRMVTLSELAR